MSINAGCECGDYAKMTANTGIVQISAAAPALDGTGATVVLTGAANGTIVKSVIIKPTGPVITGMIRLFIGTGGSNYLYREIPIPTYPATPSTPTPTPVYPMLEIDFEQEFELQSLSQLMVSSQTADTFNIIAQGLDRSYPEDPIACCDFIKKTGIVGAGYVTTANPNLNGTGNMTTMLIAGVTNGTLIKSITISALQSTHRGMVRFFISPDGGTTYYLWMEVFIPESIQSGFTPSLKQLLKDDFHLQAGYRVAASTQITESFAITIEGTSWTYPV